MSWSSLFGGEQAEQPAGLFSRRTLTFAATALAVIALDRWTKQLATEHLLDSGVRSVPMIGEYIRLTYVENRGAAFGVLQDQTAFFILVGLVVIGEPPAVEISAELKPWFKALGYLPPDPRQADSEKLRVKAGVESGQKFLLVSAGGGGDALPIYLPIIKGIEQAGQSDVKVMIVSGPLMSEDAFFDLRLAVKPLKDQVRVVRFLTQFVDWMRAADATICMGGYNTLREGAALGKPLLVIPRTYPRLEQQIRAEHFTSRGWCYTLKPDQSIEDATEHFVGQLADNELHYSVTTLPCRGFTNLFQEMKLIQEELIHNSAVNTPI